MTQFLWLISSLSMLVFILLIAFRAWHELIALNATETRSEIAREAPSIPDWAWGVAALALLWLGCFVGHVLATGSITGFFERFAVRFTQEGDAPRYLFMAENGYVREGENVINIVFYPLYPFLIRILSPLFLGNKVLCAFAISQLSYAGSAVVFFKLAKRSCRRPVAAQIAFLLYPFGFFSLGVFTEGLFLLLSVSALYLLMRKKWLGAGICAFFCALTRVQGVLLLLPGVYCAWRSLRKTGFTSKMLTVFSPLLSFLIYLSLNKIYCGDFFAFRYYESQPPWWQTAQWVGKTVAQQWTLAFEYDGIANWIYWPQLALYFIALALLFSAFHRKTDNALALYGGAYLGMCYTASWLISGGRYMLGCLPMYLAVGNMKRSGLRFSILLAELYFFIIFNTYFMQGQCIM